jgi:hypothetical protein
LKRNVFFGAALWVLFISALHVQLNVGWERFWWKLTHIGSAERQELIVGFLPVT